MFGRFKETDFEEEDLREFYIYLKKLNETENIAKLNIIAKLAEDADKLELVTEILAINLSEFEKTKLYEDMDNTFKKYYYTKRRKELLERLKENISKDEKQMLEIELGQIILKIAKMK